MSFARTMHISRSQSIFLATGVIVLFFVVGIVFVQRSNRLPGRNVQPTIPTTATAPTTLATKVTPAASATSEDNESQFRLYNFERSQTRNGKKVWEVKAKEGQYYPETNTARVTEGILWLFRDDGDAIQINAGSATLHLQGTGLKKAELFEGVTVVLKDRELKVTTDRASFEQESSRVQASGEVVIETPRMWISGVGLDGYMRAQEFTLAQNVKSLLKPAKKKAK